MRNVPPERLVLGEWLQREQETYRLDTGTPQSCVGLWVWECERGRLGSLAVQGPNWSRESWLGVGCAHCPTSAVTLHVPLFLLQLLPLTPSLPAVSLFAAPPHRLSLYTSWGPS